MGETTVYGFHRSVYVRAVRLALEEKRAAYRLVEIDPFASGGPPPEYLERHPFGRIPAFEHDAFRLYETGAITRYVDDVFPGAPLRPDQPKGRARADQIISLMDSYAYRAMIWDIYVERTRAGAPDEARIAAALPRAETCLRAMESLMGDGPFLAGQAVSLADLHAAPMLAYFRRTAEGAALMARHPGLQRWWAAMSERESMKATRFPIEREA